MLFTDQSHCCIYKLHRSLHRQRFLLNKSAGPATGSMSISCVWVLRLPAPPVALGWQQHTCKYLSEDDRRGLDLAFKEMSSEQTATRKPDNKVSWERISWAPWLSEGCRLGKSVKRNWVVGGSRFLSEDVDEGSLTQGLGSWIWTCAMAGSWWWCHDSEYTESNSNNSTTTNYWILEFLWVHFVICSMLPWSIHN